MNKDFLFIKTLEDIEKKMESRDEYEIILISGLLRKLLLDNNPLVNQVNQSRKLKIFFIVNDRQTPIGDNSLTFWAIEDGFDPNTSVPRLTKAIEVNKDQLLKRRIMIINRQTITVLDLIKFLSHVQGGIHVGKPTSSEEVNLKEIQKYLGIGGLPAGIRSILSISRVILKGLEPLKIAITQTK
jgi:hypothetical protein